MNKMEDLNLNIPNWMDIEFFNKILKQNDPVSKIEVTNFKIMIATNKGDNYASVMFRASIDFFKDELLDNKSIIVKVIPSGIIQTKVMEKNNIYPREIKVYSELLKEIEKLLLSIGDQTKLSPQCLYTSHDPKMLLVFEDLKVQNYKMKDRKVGLNLDETLLVLEKIAKLHAVSAVLQDNDPNIMDMFREGAISDNPERQDFLVFFKFNAKMLHSLVKTFDGYEEISKKLENFHEKILAKASEVYIRDENSFNVFNHDDLWVNNLMFKYINEKLDDILMIDYQLSYYGSPGVDLNYLIFGSVQDEIRMTRFNFLIKNYHITLVDVLRKLNYKKKIPTLQDIHVEIIKTGFHRVIAAVGIKPLAIMENSENADIEVFLQETQQGNSFIEKLFFNPEYINFIKTVLNDFDMMGYFD